jgi:hypothetical protein
MKIAISNWQFAFSSSQFAITVRALAEKIRYVCGVEQIARSQELIAQS